MKKRTINMDWLPTGLPFSHAVEAGDLIYLSGMGPIDAENGQIIYDDIRAATQQVLENIKRMLESMGSGLDKVLKTTVFLRNMNDYAVMNEVYVSYFPDEQPARSCVAVTQLPLDFPLEIEAVALK